MSSQGVPAVNCPQCGNSAVPEMYKEVSTAGWIVFVALLVVCFPLCWLPFVVDGLKENRKKCRACGFKF